MKTPREVFSGRCSVVKRHGMQQDDQTLLLLRVLEQPTSVARASTAHIGALP
jgi:hypothetical protein